MTSPIDAPYAHSYRVSIGHEPLNGLVSEIFSIKVAYAETDRAIAMTRRVVSVCLSVVWLSVSLETLSTAFINIVRAFDVRRQRKTRFVITTRPTGLRGTRNEIKNITQTFTFCRSLCFIVFNRSICVAISSIIDVSALVPFSCSLNVTTFWTFDWWQINMYVCK